MFVITQRFQRSVPEGQPEGQPESAFYEPSESFRAHVKANYVDTGQLLSTDVNFDDETKKLTVINCWANRETYNTFLQDPVVIQARAERVAYQDAHNITETRVAQEVPGPT